MQQIVYHQKQKQYQKRKKILQKSNINLRFELHQRRALGTLAVFLSRPQQAEILHTWEEKHQQGFSFLPIFFTKLLTFPFHREVVSS